jgi:lactate dehydrogenase-like 2-hydroxyacid dehydrogenase
LYREHNFSISGLEGFDIRGKVIGVIGTGNIGKIAAEILKGFGPSRLLAYDAYPSEDCKWVQFVIMHPGARLALRPIPV